MREHGKPVSKRDYLPLFSESYEPRGDAFLKVLVERGDRVVENNRRVGLDAFNISHERCQGYDSPLAFTEHLGRRDNQLCVLQADLMEHVALVGSALNQFDLNASCAQRPQLRIESFDEGFRNQLLREV